MADPRDPILVGWKVDKDQMAKLQEFYKGVLSKLKVTSPRFTDPIMHYKFLIMKSWKVDKALELFDAYLKYREEKQFETALERPFPQLEKLISMYHRSYYHTDREGRPLLIENIGKIKISEVFKV